MTWEVLDQVRVQPLDLWFYTLRLHVKLHDLATCLFISGTRVGSALPFRRLDFRLSVHFRSRWGARARAILQRHGSLLLKWRRESSEARAMERRHFGKARADRACFLSSKGNFIRFKSTCTVVRYRALRWRNFYRIIGLNNVHSSFKIDP